MGVFGFSRGSDDDGGSLGIGMSRGSSNCGSTSTAALRQPVRDGNPNKYRFNVKRRKNIGNACVAEINYPDCDNHDGDKILVYSDANILDMGLEALCLDPHFLHVGNSPVARFEPTEIGWKYAISFAKMIAE